MCPKQANNRPTPNAPNACSIFLDTPQGVFLSSAAGTRHQRSHARPRRFGARTSPVHCSRIPSSPIVAPSAMEDSEGKCTCWGALIKGDPSQCTPGFVVGKSHFKNKVCSGCRADGIVVSASRLRICLSPDMLQNQLNMGLWSRTKSAGRYRLINQTAGCKGGAMLLSAGVEAPTSTEFAMLPANLVDGQGMVKLLVSKGTLVPAGIATAPKRTYESMLTPAGVNAAQDCVLDDSEALGAAASNIRSVMTTYATADGASSSSAVAPFGPNFASGLPIVEPTPPHQPPHQGFSLSVPATQAFFVPPSTADMAADMAAATYTLLPALSADTCETPTAIAIPYPQIAPPSVVATAAGTGARAARALSPRADSGKHGSLTTSASGASAQEFALQLAPAKKYSTAGEVIQLAAQANDMVLFECKVRESVLNRLQIHGPCRPVSFLGQVFLGCTASRVGREASHFLALSTDISYVTNNYELLRACVQAAATHGVPTSEIQRKPGLVTAEIPAPIAELLSSEENWVNAQGVVQGETVWRMNENFENNVCSLATAEKFMEGHPDRMSCASSMWLPQDEEQNDFVDQVMFNLLSSMTPVDPTTLAPLQQDAIPNGAEPPDLEMLYAEIVSPRQWRVQVPLLKGYAQMHLRCRGCLRRSAAGVDIWLCIAYTPVVAEASAAATVSSHERQLILNPQGMPTPFPDAKPTSPSADGSSPSADGSSPSADGSSPVSLPEPPLDQPRTTTTSPMAVEQAVRDDFERAINTARVATPIGAAAPTPDAGSTGVFAPHLPLGVNCHRLIGVCMRRPLGVAEAMTIDQALEEGLCLLLQQGSAEDRRVLLGAPMLSALSNPTAAQLWACIVDATESEVKDARKDASALAATIVSKCTSIASAAFTSAIGL